MFMDSGASPLTWSLASTEDRLRLSQTLKREKEAVADERRELVTSPPFEVLRLSICVGTDGAYAAPR